METECAFGTRVFPCVKAGVMPDDCRWQGATRTASCTWGASEQIVPAGSSLLVSSETKMGPCDGLEGWRSVRT